MLGRLTNAELRALIGQTDLTDDELTALATRLAVLAEVALSYKYGQSDSGQAAEADE